jgi:glycosyltransferase involved in cell wall biosynthesis
MKPLEKFPKISVVTPSYNQGKFIERTILSVIEQNYPNVEYIIIDGGSKDETIDVIKKYESYISYWVSEPDKGQSDALNKGLSRATGDIIAWINSDDYYALNTFHAVASILSNPDAYIVNGNCMMEYSDSSLNYIDKSGKITFLRMLQYWKPHFCPPQPAIFFKRSVLEDIGYINEKLHYSMDLDLWLRMSLKYEFIFKDQLFAHYLIHDDSKSGSANGFQKFIPEWKSTIEFYLNHHTSLFTRLQYEMSVSKKKSMHYIARTKQIIKKALK